MPDGLSLTRHGLPLAYTLVLWWFSTGIILYLDGLPRRTYRWSFGVATAVLLGALYGIARSSAGEDLSSVYVAFTCAVLVWGWNEMGFLMGFFTGPRRTVCPSSCRGWRHFGHAVEVLLYHELAILASAVVVAALAWGQPNQAASWTFVVLWWMRISTKLNVFLGVPNVTEEFLPAHLEYLKGFFTKRPMNLLFPASITVSTVVTVLLAQRAIDPAAGVSAAVTGTFLASLMALAVLEHWFLVLPLPATKLWQWGLRSRGAPRPSRVRPEAPVLPLRDRARRRDDSTASTEAERGS